MNNQPLFSVIVITYNSASYILDTLNSIKDQGYKKLELIISDDFSTDDTIEICKQWLAVHAGEFVSSCILVPQQNQGIPANCNQGLKAATGDWVKIIAGDDAFYPNAFEMAAEFVDANPKVKAFASSFAYFKDDFKADNEVRKRDDSALAFYKADATKQYFLLLRNNYIHATTVFLSRPLLIDLGGFIESYRMLEDHPMWLLITSKGDKFHYLPAYTVKYRLHTTSVFSHTSEQQLFNNFYLKKRAFDLEMVYPHLRWYERLSQDYTFQVKKSIDFLKMNKQTAFCRFLYRFLMGLSPVSIIKLVRNSAKSHQISKGNDVFNSQ